MLPRHISIACLVLLLRCTAFAGQSEDSGNPSTPVPIPVNAPENAPPADTADEVLHPDTLKVPELRFSIGDIPYRAILSKPLEGKPEFTVSINSVPRNQWVESVEMKNQAIKADHVAVFEDPCHFDYTLFGRHSRHVRESLLVYEGMRIAVKTDGYYEVSFAAEVPRIPVVLRLWLEVSTTVDGQTLRRGSISLPPVVFEPQTSLSRHQPGRTVIVTRRGHSHLLRRIIQHESAEGISFARNGRARFGSIPPRGEYSIIRPENVSQ